MQLNNKNTNEIIKIVSITESGVAYDYYTNPFASAERKTNVLTLDFDFIPENPMSVNKLKEFLAYTELNKFYTDYEISEDEKNWCINIGSTGLDTTVRVLFPSKLISANIYTNSTLGQLMEALKSLKPFTTESSGNIIQYLEEILDVPVIEGLTPIEILNSYPDIQIEYKN